MPTSSKKHGGRAVTATYPVSDIFALHVATLLKGAQTCSMSPIVRTNAGAALSVLKITATAWTSTQISRYVTEPCLRKLGDIELSPYINKLMASVVGRDGRKAKTMEFLRDMMLHFIYHIGAVDMHNPVVDHESFIDLCKKAQIDEILQFKALGGCDEYSVDRIVTEEDWDNSTLLDVPRIARIPDEIFLTIHANTYNIKPEEWLLYFMNGLRRLERIQQVGVRRRRQTEGVRLAGEAAVASAAEFRAAEEEDGFAATSGGDGQESDDGAAQQQQQRQRVPGSAQRGMGAAGTPNGLDPMRVGTRQSHNRHVQQALSMQTRLQKNNQQVLALPTLPTPCPTPPAQPPEQPSRRAAAQPNHPSRVVAAVFRSSATWLRSSRATRPARCSPPS